MMRWLAFIFLLVSGLCFAQSETAQFNETISSEPRGSEYEYLLVGIEVDGLETGFAEILRKDDDYLVPLIELFEAINSSYNLNQDALDIQTPGGNLSLPADLLSRVDTALYLPLSAINANLFLNAQFDSGKYALVMSLPWRQEGRAAVVIDQPEIEADFKPPPVSLRQIRLNSRYRDSESTDGSLTNELRGAGALLDGAWYFDLVQPESEQPVAEDYYWLRTTRHQQWFVGRQNIALNPVARNQESTGVQWLYSSQPLDLNSRRVPTANDFARNLGRTSRNIAGTGQPGARAELYIDGRRTASELIRLDGTYEFRDIELGSRGYREVIVEISDRSTGSVLSRQNFSQNFSSLSFEQGQIVTAAGFGLIGNELDPNDQREGETWYVQQRVGLTDRITLEGAYQRTENAEDILLGSTIALGDHYLVNASSRTRDGETNSQIDLDRFGSDWQLTLNGRQENIDADAEFYALRFRRQANSNVVWGISGRYLDNALQTDQFIKPGLSWRPINGLWINSWPNSTGRYQTDIHYRANQKARVDASYEMESFRVEAQYTFDDNREYYLSVNQNPGLANLYEAGVNWYLANAQSVSTFRFGALSDTRGEMGSFVHWERNLFPGARFELQFADRPARRDNLRSPWQFTAEITFDFGYNGRRFVPRGGFYSSLTKGTVSGEIEIIGRDRCDIDRVSILIDGYPRIVESEGCGFIVENLAPGLHQIRLDAETLPLDLAPEDTTYWAEIGMSAVTRVDFSIAPEYGASGLVSDANGDAVAAAPLAIYQLPENTLLYRARSDQFGYYRADRLNPGRYRIQANRNGDSNDILGSIEFTIKDDYLFDQDIQEKDFAECPGKTKNPVSYAVQLCQFRQLNPDSR